MLYDKDTRKNTRTKLGRKVEKRHRNHSKAQYICHIHGHFGQFRKVEKIYIYNQYKFANVTFIGLRGQHFQSHNQPLTTF